MRWYPSREMIKQSWEKYGLIVVGNIVFFILLYFISYRPHNAENRAAEFLSMAQEQETLGRNEAAMVLYNKVIKTYPETRAATTSRARLPVVKKLVAAPIKPEPELIPPRLDLETMLNQTPSVYVATYLAEHYDDDPTQTAKIMETIKKYLFIASNHDGIDVKRLRHEKEFQKDLFKRELFNIRPKCEMRSDWFYDDFSIKNTNFFSWHNVNIKIEVSQGSESEKKDMRLPLVKPGHLIEMLEFRVRGSEGTVTCKGEITAEEGKTTWSQQM